MNKPPRKCPFCKNDPFISEPYTLSDKPAYDMGCNHKDCPVKPKLWEQRDYDNMLKKWEGPEEK